MEETLYVDVMIGGLSVPFLVDTGSSFTFLNEEVWNQVSTDKMPLKPVKADLRGVGGGALQVKGESVGDVEPSNERKIAKAATSMGWTLHHFEQTG